MGNAQNSVCFKFFFKVGEDYSDAKNSRKLWPIEVRDIDLKEGVMGDYIKGYKVMVITNVASM